jgi:polyisoprenoid-binding protein YceI
MTDTIQAAGYALRPDRCVIEVTRRPLVRARFPAIDGTLVTDGARSMTITVDAGSLKTATPWLGAASRGPKRLSANDHTTIRFESQQAGGWIFEGRLTVQGAWYDLVLRSRVVHSDDNTVIISAKGRTGRVRVEIAAEFGR